MTVLRVCYKHGARFDEGYYISTHTPIVNAVMGPHGAKNLEMIKVTSTPGAPPPPYQVIFSAYFDSPAGLQAAMQDPRIGEVMGDIANFHDGVPDVMIGEVVALPAGRRAMRRTLGLGTLIAVGALSLAVAGQAPAGPSAAALAAMKIEKVKDNLYILTGSGVGDAFSGGNAAVFITDGGVTLVDTKLPGFGQTMLDRIKTVTTKPVTRIINTHAHGDHTSNNGFFGANVEIIVQENAKSVMAKLPEWSGANAQHLPNKTYRDKLTVGTGKDQIDLYYFGPGHTSGDTFVVFPALRTMHVGDMFAWKALPYVDTGAGGSVVAQPASLGKLVSTVKNVDTIINGHIPVSTWNDLKEYAAFTKDFVAFAERAMKAGKTVDQAAAEVHGAVEYKGYVVSVGADIASAKGNLQIAYDELKKK